MSKIRYFITMLLAVVGFGAVQAQTYGQGGEVTDIASVAASADGTQEATPILLVGSGVQSWNPSEYLSPYGFYTTLADACVYELYATGETVESNGEDVPTYRIWNVSLQKWLRAETYGPGSYASSVENPEASGVLHAYTTDVSEAYVCTILNSEDGSDNARTKCSTYDAGAWILAEAEEQPGGVGIGYFGTYGTGGFFSIYTDTNQWRIYEAEGLQGDARLQAYLISEFPNGLTYYNSIGTGVGCLSQSAYDALSEAYEEASALIGSTLTEEQVEAAEEKLAAAKAAAEAAFILPEAGKYYFLVNTRSTSTLTVSGGYLVATTGYELPDSTITVDDTKYIWKFEDAGNGQFYLRNFYTGQYGGETSTTSANVPVTTEAEVPLNVVLSMQNEPALTGYFNVYSETCHYHVAASYSVVRWNYQESSANLYKIVECSDSLVNAISGALEQENLNNELLDLFDTAEKAYYAGRSYTGETFTLDGNFDDLGLVQDASMLSTNAQETTEGSLEALLDANFTSYFHSIWSSSSAAPSTYHYIQADLGESVETLALKFARRHNNHTYSPTTVRIYGSNDAENWNLCATTTFSYDYTATVSDVETANFVGVSAVDLGASYRYVRMDVIECRTSGGTINGYPYFYLSELHFYPATYNAAESPLYEGVSEAVRTNFSTVLAKAAAELSNAAATEQTIADLQSAYAAFRAEYADPQILTDSVAAAKVVAAAGDSLVGTALGLYPQEALDALNQVITSVEATIATGMSMDLINSGVAQLNEAIDAFNHSYNIPEAGKIYAIRGITTVSTNTRALNAPVYSTGNSQTTALKSQAQESGADPIRPVESVNYMWEVMEVSHDSIVLRNVGTNYYIGKVDELSEGVPNVAEKTVLGLSPVNMTTGGFYLQVGDALYLNFAGGSEDMVGWSSHSGLDNSALQFEELSMDEWEFSAFWNVEPDVYQVITLPFEIYTPSSDDGMPFTALGQRESNGSYTIELQEYTDETIPAGTPFVFLPADGATDFLCILAVEDVSEIAYAAEGTTTENGALSGSISEVVLTEGGKAILSEGALSIIGNPDVPYTVAANSGYFNNDTTTDTGDYSLPLRGDNASGIGAVKTISAAAAADVYTVSGVLVRKGAKTTSGLPKGLYIMGGKKVLVK